MIRLGLVVNPVAGLGGRVGLGGSDGRDTQCRALTLGAVPHAGERATAALRELTARGGEFELLTASGAMGDEAARGAGLRSRVVDRAVPAPVRVWRPGGTGASDTVAAVRALAAHGVDLLLFAGGDGTARDVLTALGEGSTQPVLGIPTGVKMHSAVFAVNPRAAGEVAAAWLAPHGRPELRGAEVMDRDEEQLRKGRLSSRLYGWLPVPYVPVRVQQRKAGSTAASPEAVGGMAAELASRLSPEDLLILGPGTTTRMVAAALGADTPLTGVSALARVGASALTCAEVSALARADASALTCADASALTCAGVSALARVDAAGLSGRVGGCGVVGCPGSAARAAGPETGPGPGSGSGSRAGSCGCGVAGRAVPRAPGVFPAASSLLRSPRGRRDHSSAATGRTTPSYRPVATHLDSAALLALAHRHPLVIALSPIGGQGFLLGRGNQQISPELLRAVGPDKLLVLATEAKLAALHGRPLLVDTGDDDLDAALAGYVTVLTGRGRTALYRLTH
ncbi:NAD(+)/NADH kinase [Streptomyces sp. NPDC048442]|uniref:ATP-NAD kinase family protein n=1 Tax=Streptomyces sp. NPDC048442 TaxID=3154823 RepID=UPI003444FA30